VGVLNGVLFSENNSAVLSIADLTVFNATHPRPPGAASGNDAVMNLLNW
jgi:hypothetical protein